MENRFQRYKGLYYRYLPSKNIWQILYDRTGNKDAQRTMETEYVFNFNADLRRLDECFEFVFDEINKINN